MAATLFFEFGHFRFQGALLRTIKNTLAKESTRYALQCVSIKEGLIVATNGKKLVVLERHHEIRPGLYYVTQDGYLLENPLEGNFPKWQDTLLQDPKSVEIKGCQTPEQLFSRIVYHFNKNDSVFDLIMLRDTLMPMLKQDADEIIVQFKEPDHAIQVKMTVGIGKDTTKCTFVQMPMNEG